MYMNDFDYFDETGEDGFEYGSVSGLTLDKSKEGSPFLEGLAHVRSELTRLGYRAQDFTNAGPKIEMDARLAAKVFFHPTTHLLVKRGVSPSICPGRNLSRK